MLPEPEQNWFLTKSAPNSLSNPLLYPSTRPKAASEDDVIKEESLPPPEKVRYWNVIIIALLK